MHVQYSGIHLAHLIADTPFDGSFIVEYDDLRNKHGDETLQQKLKEASNHDSISIFGVCCVILIEQYQHGVLNQSIIFYA